MAASKYKEFVRLLEKWPRDPTKEGRDLAMYLREWFATRFRHGETTKINHSEVSEVLQSLSIIASDRHRETYKVSEAFVATGAAREHCRQIISSEMLKLMQQDAESPLAKVQGIIPGYKTPP